MRARRNKANVSLLAMIFAIILSAFPLGNLFSQTTVTGTLNTVQSAATGVSMVTNAVTVASSAGFSIGDTVVVIQMKGAQVNTANSAAFGDITTTGQAGKYEINSICDIQGNDLILQQEILNSYDVSSLTQVVKVAAYTNAILGSDLNAPAWNGTTGGVFAISCSGWLRLKPGTAINMDYRGFRTGAHQNVADGCGCSGSDPNHSDYHYPAGDNRGANKGEGIAAPVAGRENGRGKLSSGGGGGNDHNAGGGGGSNYGAGGVGGSPCSTRSCFFGQYCRGLNPGVGGAALSPYYSNAENRVFLGGGGGAGDDNGGAGNSIGTGGGIVIIIADSINGLNGDILARGQVGGQGAGDGAGGGGAGGSIILDIRAFHPTLGFNARVNGGRGGWSNWGVQTYNSKGKGGGGSGGVVWHSNAALPATVNTFLSGGIAGYELGASCPGDSGGAVFGQPGAVLNNLSLPINSVSWGPCVLPVTYTFFTAKATPAATAVLDWQTATESNNSHFVVQHSANGLDYVDKGSLQAKAGNGQGATYQWTDPSPATGNNWYRLKQVDFNGSENLSEVRTVFFDANALMLNALFPNPLTASRELNADIYMPEGDKVTITLFEVSGKKVHKSKHELAAGNNQLRLSLDKLAKGMYFLKIHSPKHGELTRMVSVPE